MYHTDSLVRDTWLIIFDTTRICIPHTWKWLKIMRNQNGIDSYHGSVILQDISDLNQSTYDEI